MEIIHQSLDESAFRLSLLLGTVLACRCPRINVVATVNISAQTNLHLWYFFHGGWSDVDVVNQVNEKFQETKKEKP